MTARIAYFVSAHGFGHAARSSAALNALHRVRPDVVPQIFTTVPQWFWEDSIEGPYELREALTDVGMVQLSPLEEDPAATLQKLQALRPFDVKAAGLAEALRRLECALVVCDISPLGLAAAKLAGIPSVLVESFTWDWIYETYFDAEPGLREVAAEMAELFDGADLRIQTEPVCRPVAGALSVPPVYRRARSTPTEARALLGLERDRRIVLITMGGTATSFGFLERLQQSPDLDFVAFAGTKEIECRGNVVLLPDRSPVFVPDLIAAAEVAVGKLGYSTVAEAWGAGTRYMYVSRPRFPEGPFLAAFVRDRLPSLEIEESAFSEGDWLEALPELLRHPRAPRAAENGADRIGDRLADVLRKSS